MTGHFIVLAKLQGDGLSDIDEQLFRSDFVKEDTELYLGRIIQGFNISASKGVTNRNDLARKVISYAHSLMDELIYWAHAHFLGQTIFQEYPDFRRVVEGKIGSKIGENHWAHEILGELLIRGQNPSFDPTIDRQDKTKQVFEKSNAFEELSIDVEKFFNVSQSNTDSRLRADGEIDIANMREYWKSFINSHPTRYKRVFGVEGYDLPNHVLHIVSHRLLATNSNKNGWWRNRLRSGFFELTNGVKPSLFEQSVLDRVDPKASAKDFENFVILLHVRYNSKRNGSTILHEMTEISNMKKISNDKQLTTKTIRAWQTKLNKVEDFKLYFDAADLAGELSRFKGDDWSKWFLREDTYGYDCGSSRLNLAELVHFYLLQNPIESLLRPQLI